MVKVPLTTKYGNGYAIGRLDGLSGEYHLRLAADNEYSLGYEDGHGDGLREAREINKPAEPPLRGRRRKLVKADKSELTPWTYF
jgi:hypothetical protein